MTVATFILSTIKIFKAVIYIYICYGLINNERTSHCLLYTKKIQKYVQP